MRAFWRYRCVARDGRILMMRFDVLALDLFRYQARNEPIARFARSLASTSVRCRLSGGRFRRCRLRVQGCDARVVRRRDARPSSSIPAGRRRAVRHALHGASRLYDAALLAGFERFMLADGARPRFVNLVPDPARNPHSSLGYMMRRVAEHFGAGSRFYLRDDGIDLDALRRDLADAREAGRPVCIAGTAFAFASLVDGFADGSFAVRGRVARDGDRRLQGARRMRSRATSCTRGSRGCLGSPAMRSSPSTG